MFSFCVYGFGVDYIEGSVVYGWERLIAFGMADGVRAMVLGRIKDMMAGCRILGSLDMHIGANTHHTLETDFLVLF